MEKLTEVLQRLPLAMNQAVSCMEQLCLTVADYLADFARKVSSVLGFSSSKAEKTVLTTWSVSIEKISGEKGGRLAHSLLKFLAYVSPDGTPKELMLGMAESKAEFGQALRLLQVYSLVKV